VKSASTASCLDLAPIFGPKAEGFLSRALAALRETLPVAEVWIFGSCARGDATPDSDLDLLVVLTDDHGLQQPNLACYRAIRKRRSGIPTDDMAISQSRWDQEQTDPFGLFGDVCREGIQLYAHRSEESAALV
jgi:hypothetical protein